MRIKTIIAAGIGVLTLAGAANAGTPSIAPNTDVFSSGSYQGGNTTGTTGTQGVVGNPNCPPPTLPGGGHPLNWSCRTGTQGIGPNLLAQNPNNNPRGYLLGNGTAPQTPPPGARGRLLGNVSQAAPQQRSPQQVSTRPQQPQFQQPVFQAPPTFRSPYIPSGGAGVNQRLGSSWQSLNNSPRLQLLNGVARALGQRQLVMGPQQSTVGSRFNYGAPVQSGNNQGLGRGQFIPYTPRFIRNR